MPKAIIVGATSGIGKELALQLLAKGWELGIAGRRTERLEEIKAQAEQFQVILEEQMKLEEAERLKKELLGTVDGDDYLKEQVIELRYQNQMLQEENRSLKDKLEKAYEFMKQFVIGGMNLLERFWEWIGEKVRDVGRGR